MAEISYNNYSFTFFHTRIISVTPWLLGFFSGLAFFSYQNKVQSSWMVLWSKKYADVSLLPSTDWGRPMKQFFIKIKNFWAWADKVSKLILGHLVYFWPKYQHPFWYSESLVMFFIIQPLFLQKTKPLYPHPKYLFGIGIWTWAAQN